MSQSATQSPTGKATWILPIAAWIAASAIAIILYQLRSNVLNVVSYQMVNPPMVEAVTTLLIPVIVIGALIALAIRLTWTRASVTTLNKNTICLVAIATVAIAALASVAWTGRSLGFWSIGAVCVLAGVLTERLVDAESPRIQVSSHALFMVALIAAIIVATAWHAWMQHTFWQHFMLGYADFGLYTRELEYCLFYNDIADRWANSRMAYHFEPLFYALAPAYALFRSPVFLMIVGPLALNVAGLAFYDLVQRRTQSPLAGLIAGLTWLALPSISRMPYANTYGFESVYLAVPLLAFCFAAAHRDRWRTSHVLLALAVLCQETLVAVAVGWGVYVAIIHRRRRDGIVIVIAAVVFLLVCVGLIISSFSAQGGYVRSEMLGELGVATIFARYARENYWAFLLALTAPLLPSMIRRPQLLLAAAPVLMMLGLIENTEYLSVKFWHQSSVLPVLFTCACLGATRRREAAREPSNRITFVGTVTGMFVGALLMHYFMGFSPLAQNWRAMRANPSLQQTDPRIKVIEQVRQTFPPEQIRIAATERFAAHLIDYNGLTNLDRITNDTDLSAHDVFILDTADTWDAVVRGERKNELMMRLRASGFIARHNGDVVIFARKDTEQPQ